VGLDRDADTCLADIFDAGHEFHSCGRWLSAAKARLAIPKCEPRFLLVELALPDDCGVRYAREALAHQSELHIVLVSAGTDTLLLERAAAVGIADLLVKPFTVDRCLARLRFLLYRCHCGQGAKFAGSGAARHFRDGHQHPLAQPLLDVEKTVLDCLAEGLMYKEIAVRMAMSEAAVKKLTHGVYEKLHVHSRTQALIAWRECGGPDSEALDQGWQLASAALAVL
jgi:DNA-binding NarL/FixJ family response regulator